MQNTQRCRLCIATSCCARAAKTTQHSLGFLHFKWVCHRLSSRPKFFKGWQQYFSIINLKPEIKIMAFYWERFLKPCSTGLALPSCCITAPWRSKMETRLHWSPLHASQIVLVWSISLQQEQNFRTNKYYYQSFKTTVITNMLRLNSNNMVRFALTVHLLHNCSEQNFVELPTLEAVKRWFVNSQVCVLLSPVLHTMTVTASSYEHGLTLAKTYQTLLKRPLHLHPEHSRKLRKTLHFRACFWVATTENLT